MRVECDGVARSVEVGAGRAEPCRRIRARLESATRSTSTSPAGASRFGWLPPDVDAAARAAVAHGVAGATGPAEVFAPMPGAVLTVHVAVGQVVAAGDPIVTLEAMKMEHVVAATIGGRIGDVRVRPADQVTRGQLLAMIEP